MMNNQTLTNSPVNLPCFKTKMTLRSLNNFKSSALEIKEATSMSASLKSLFLSHAKNLSRNMMATSSDFQYV